MLSATNASLTELTTQSAEAILTIKSQIEAYSNQTSVLRKNKSDAITWLTSTLGEMPDEKLGEEKTIRTANDTLCVTRIDKQPSKQISSDCLDFIICNIETNAEDCLNLLDRIQEYKKKYYEMKKREFLEKKNYVKVYKIKIQPYEEWRQQYQSLKKKKQAEEDLKASKRMRMTDSQIQAEEDNELKKQRKKIKQRFIDIYARMDTNEHNDINII
jgi:hypothetical protein